MSYENCTIRIYRYIYRSFRLFFHAKALFDWFDESLRSGTTIFYNCHDSRAERRHETEFVDKSETCNWSRRDETNEDTECCQKRNAVWAWFCSLVVSATSCLDYAMTMGYIYNVYVYVYVYYTYIIFVLIGNYWIHWGFSNCQEIRHKDIARS